MMVPQDELRTWADELIDDEFTGVSTHQTISLEPNNSEVLQKHFSICQDNHYIYIVLTGFNYDKSCDEHCRKIFSNVLSYLPLELLEQISSLGPDPSDDKYVKVLKETFRIIEQSIRENLSDILSEKTALEIQLSGNETSDFPKLREKLDEISRKLSIGFSCVVTVLNDEKIYVANIGNIRAILCSRNDDNSYIKYRELSTRHDLTNPNELRRLENISINTEELKLNQIGNMTLTRCLGNLMVKDFFRDFNALFSAIKDPILWQPSIECAQINESSLFLIIASASLFEILQKINENGNVFEDLLRRINDKMCRINDLKKVPDSVINDIIQIYNSRFNTENSTLKESLINPILLIRTFPSSKFTLISDKTYTIINETDKTMTYTSDETDTRTSTSDESTTKIEEVDPYVNFQPIFEAMERVKLDYDSF